MPQSKTRELHRKLTINSASNMLRYILTMGIAFFLTPFIVRTLGDSLYGFWVLLISFIGYASILEMGVQPAVVKLVGQYRAVGEVEKLREMVTAAFTFFLVVGLLAAALAVTVLPGIIQNHVEDLRSLPRPNLLFLVIALDAMVMYMNYLVTGILYGSQKYHVKNIIDVVAQVLNATLLVLFLEKGGIIALVSAKLAMDLTVAIGATLAVGRIAPELRLSPGLLSRGSFRELMGFGGRVFVSATTTRLASNAPPVIISTAVSSAATAVYAIPVRLISYTQQIAWTLTASFMPMFSELDSQGDRDTMRHIYLSYSRYIFMILMPLIVGLFVYGISFIGLWIGADFAEGGAGVLLLLTAAALLDSSQPLLWRFFIGIGELGVLIKVSAVMSILTILGSIALVNPLGITGVALGVFAGAVLAQSSYAVYSCRQLDMTLGHLLSRVHLRPMLSGAMMALVAFSLFRTLGADSYLRIFSGGALSTLAYAGLAYRFALEPQERNTLREILARRLRR